MTNDDIRTAPGPTGDPVGRVRPSTEPDEWAAGAEAGNEGAWTIQRVAIGVVVILIMAGLLTFILWGAYRSA